MHIITEREIAFRFIPKTRYKKTTFECHIKNSKVFSGTVKEWKCAKIGDPLPSSVSLKVVPNQAVYHIKVRWQKTEYSNTIEP